MAAERARRRPLSLPTRLAVVLGGVAVFLGVMLYLQLQVYDGLSDRRDDLVYRVEPATTAVVELRYALADQESGVRGYATDGHPVFLEAYERGRAEAAEALDRLAGLPVGDPPIGEQLAELGRVLAAWQEATAEPVVTGGPDAVTDQDLADGRARFEQVVAAVDDLDRAVGSARQADLAALDDDDTAVLVTMFAQVGGLVLLGAIITLALTHQVVTPLAQLGTHARQVAEGDLDRRVVGHGSPELVRLGEDVEAMRERIVAELAELRLARIELERQHADLVRSNDDLEQFAYVASHDLQEPLRKVSGFCQLLERRYADRLDDRAREYIWYANDGARRMQDLINDLLAFSRVGRTTEAFVPVDLREVTEEAVAVFSERIAESGATVTVGDLPVVRGDRRLLAQVMHNLVGNALKFHRDDPPVVDVSAVDDGEAWVVSVSDNGIGIDPAYAEQIFTIFKRLHNKTEYKGTGIGLALSKKIVEFHGGRIWLDTDRSPGATFSFSLPHHPVSPGAHAEASAT